MLILKANPEDATEILSVQRKAFHSEAELHHNFTIPPMVQTLESLIADFQAFEFYKAVIQGEIVASVKVCQRAGLALVIGRLIVLPQFQRRGIGRKLMLHIEQEYPGMNSYELFTAEKSVHNIRFYNALGYRIVSTFHEPGHDAIVLVKMVKRIELNSYPE